MASNAAVARTPGRAIASRSIATGTWGFLRERDVATAAAPGTTEDRSSTERGFYASLATYYPSEKVLVW